jgi:hypothetical protein
LHDCFDQRSGSWMYGNSKVPPATHDEPAWNIIHFGFRLGKKNTHVNVWILCVHEISCTKSWNSVACGKYSANLVNRSFTFEPPLLIPFARGKNYILY